MDIDWGTVGEAGSEDLRYIREHLLKTALTGALFVGVGMLVPGGWGILLLGLGVLHRFFSWVAAARAADGDESKIQEARKEFVRFLEALLLAGFLRALRTGRSANGEERLPDVARPPKSTSVVPTVSAGETLTKAVDGPVDAVGPNQNPLVPASGRGRQTIATPGSVEGFVPVSGNMFAAIRALSRLSPPERWESLQRMVKHELDTHFVPPVVFRHGKYSRLIVKEWALEFPSEWLQGPIDGEIIAGRLASRINEVIEYWAVAYHCAGSPTLTRIALRQFPDRLVREAEKRQRMGPVPITDPDRVSQLVTALPAHLDWPNVRQELARARRDYAEPTVNPMISALEGASIFELELEAGAVKQQMTGYATALGSRRAAHWARQQYRAPTDLRTPALQTRPHALRHDNFEFDGKFFQRMELARSDWAYPEVDMEQRCHWLTDLLNEQLANWGVPRWKVVPGQAPKLDPEKLELILSEEILQPQMAAHFEIVYQTLAYQAVKIAQHWKVLKYRLQTKSPAPIEAPKTAVAAAQKQLPMPLREFRRAGQLHDSMDSRFLIVHQLDESYDALRKKQFAVHDALEGLDPIEAESDPRVDNALSVWQEALQHHEQLSTAFSERPEEDEAWDAVVRTMDAVRALASMKRLGGP